MPAFLPSPTGRPGVCADAASRQKLILARLGMADKIAIMGLSLSLALVGCAAKAQDQHDVSMPTSNASITSGMVTSAPLETATASQTLPVYWLGHSNDDVFLYREFVPAKITDDPMVAALRTMMGTEPRDPDYFSIWNSPSRLGASISAKNVITIDVSADAFGQKVDKGIAERAIDQLVYTATAAAAMAGLVDTTTSIQVSVLVDGHTGYDAFGHVVLDKPLTRDAAYVAPVWIIDPADGSTYSALPLKVTGRAVSTTGTVVWSLAHMDGDKVDGQYLSGTASIPQGPNELGEYGFNLVPPPGKYQLSVYIEDPMAPGKKIGIDTKTVTIAGPAVK
ncbi:Gmad2 immunoglobulin-like domain-containing protein [Arthrobacter sp. LAPM80]|uniref:GerMN domain-containing protein n=1 Tax=Arthrobacter sp. LAPM80 TaxID=3141788 RepID=UPI00398AD193